MLIKNKKGNHNLATDNQVLNNNDFSDPIIYLNSIIINDNNIIKSDLEELTKTRIIKIKQIVDLEDNKNDIIKEASKKYKVYHYNYEVGQEVLLTDELILNEENINFKNIAKRFINHPNPTLPSNKSFPELTYYKLSLLIEYLKNNKQIDNKDNKIFNNVNNSSNTNKDNSNKNKKKLKSLQK